ncbi:MAG: hypothetical protein M3442_00250 [Chloroflexota bacterium]|nr:hypothetical protein [Chloroflexota bacterium]
MNAPPTGQREAHSETHSEAHSELPDAAEHRRILEAYDRLQQHPELDGQGVQLAVDLDHALMGAGMRPEVADGLSREELAEKIAGFARPADRQLEMGAA